MLKVIAAVFALIHLASSVSALTITPGTGYVGDYVISGADAVSSSCCPIISIDSPVKLAAFSFFISGDLLDPGEGFDVTIREGNVVPPPSQNWTSSFVNLGLSPVASLAIGGPSDVVNISAGKIYLTAVGGTFDLDRLEIFGIVNATVSHPTLGPLATDLPVYADVTNWRAINVPPPPPSPVPLPASFFLLGSVLAGLFGLRKFRRRFGRRFGRRIPI